MTAGGSSGLVAQRLAAQLLSGTPARATAEVAGRLLAIQAQDPRGARLAVRARSHGLSAADVDTALTQDRSVLVTWLNRGTLHLVRAEDYWWLHPPSQPGHAGSTPAGPACRRRACLAPTTRSCSAGPRGSPSSGNTAR